MLCDWEIGMDSECLKVKQERGIFNTINYHTQWWTGFISNQRIMFKSSHKRRLSSRRGLLWLVISLQVSYA